MKEDTQQMGIRNGRAMKIEIYSRCAMEAKLRQGKLENTAVISFYDPESSRTPKEYCRLAYGSGCGRVFYVPDHDIDIEILEEYGLTFDTYFLEVKALAKFIHRAVADGIEVFANYRYYPNQLIFSKLRAALKEVGV